MSTTIPGTDNVSERLTALEKQIARIALHVGADVGQINIAPPDPDTKSRWVIEGMWKSGVHYYGCTEEGMGTWTPDHNLALGLASEADARGLAAVLRVQGRVAGSLTPVNLPYAVRA